jgi:hypothetical protein
LVDTRLPLTSHRWHADVWGQRRDILAIYSRAMCEMGLHLDFCRDTGIERDAVQTRRR